MPVGQSTTLGAKGPVKLKNPWAEGPSILRTFPSEPSYRRRVPYPVYPLLIFLKNDIIINNSKLSKAKEKGQYYVNHIRSGFPQPHVLAAACFYYRDYPGGYLFILRRRQCLPGASSVSFRRAHRYGHGALLPHRLPHRHGEPALKYSYPSSFPEVHGEILHPHYHSGHRVLLCFH